MTCLTELIGPDPRISLRRQCELLEVCRGSYYYEPCLETEENLALMRRLISNTDQGSQFTSPMFIDAVESAGVDVSMDGRGRWLDNRFIERLWRSVKYEDIYVQDYGGGLDAGRGLGRWFDRYNQERPHQGLGYATPAAVYHDPGAYGAQPARWEATQPQPGRKARSI